MGGRGGSSHRTSAGRTSSAFDFLRRAYGENHANAVLAILQNAPEHIRSMWDDFSGQFRSTSLSRNARSAFYAPADDSVHLNISRVARGDIISTPYSVLFHEYGHMTDYLIARAEGYGRYSAYSALFHGLDSSGNAIMHRSAAGGLLGRTAKNELEGHLSRIRRYEPNMTHDQAADRLINEAMGKYSRLLDQLKSKDLDSCINGSQERIPGSLSLSFKGADGEMMLHRLDLMGTAVATGSACDSKNIVLFHVIRAIEVPQEYAHGTIRITLGMDNTPEQMDKIAHQIETVLH